MKPEELTINGTRVWKFFRGEEVLGYLGIDTEIAGKACGGLRYLPDVDAEEIAGLARAMTLKYGFLGLPQGGSKAGIIALPGEDEAARKKRLRDFGQALTPWLKDGKYFPGTDMGINIDDLNVIIHAAGISLKPWQLGCRESGIYTAATVFAGIQAACRQKGRQVKECTFSIEGFGAVGGSLAGMLHQAGGKVVAVSTTYGTAYEENGLDIPCLVKESAKGEKQLFEKISSRGRINHDELKELAVDVFSPCARHDSITGENASNIQAWAVVPGANNPVTPDAERILLSRGISVIPDFVSNSGGVLGGTMAFAGVEHSRIISFILRRFDPVYLHLYQENASTGMSLREVAEKLSGERHRKTREKSDHPSLPGKLLRQGLGLYRAGLFPKRIMGWISMSYFKNLPVFSEIPGRISG